VHSHEQRVIIADFLLYDCCVRDYEDAMMDLPVVGDVVLLRTGSTNVQNRMTDAGFRGFLLPIYMPGLETSRPRTTRRWSGPKDPHSVGLVLEVLEVKGTLRGKRALILWRGEVLEGRLDDFVPIRRMDLT
jgi:hypothetical protein